MSIYNIDVVRNTGETLSMEEFKGKTLLIVNTASKCGFTSQYGGLETLYKQFSDRGLVVLGFPCNQFGQQEPGDAEEIAGFCDLNFGVTFPLFSKVDVNGDDAAPLFKFLKKQAPGVMGSEKIKWNFTKFLVNKDGEVVNRYASTTKPESLAKEIEKIID